MSQERGQNGAQALEKVGGFNTHMPVANAGPASGEGGEGSAPTRNVMCPTKSHRRSHGINTRPVLQDNVVPGVMH